MKILFFNSEIHQSIEKYSPSLKLKLIKSMFTFATYSVSAFVMLVLMTFNIYVIFFVIAGHTIGYVVAGSRLEKDNKNELG